MPWEERNGRRYYYRKVRRGGRVFSVYEGSGVGAVLAEEQDATERATRRRETRTLRAELAEHDAIDEKLDRAWKIVERTAHEALEAAGYHSHKREWRLRRDATKTG
jgi:hypothetical protein